MTICVGNVSKVDVIKHRMLPLPSRLVLNINNNYLVFALSIDMIGSCLSQYGYSFKENTGYSFYLNNTFNGLAPKMNGSLNLGHGNTHVHAKRCRVNTDSTTFLWHCLLGHIGVRCMKKLHVDGCLESLDFESLDTCEPCLMGRMTKTPLSGTMKWASDLLEIIHADACDPMRIEACGGYRYFLIFTYDLSRYRYIYLMKHKSETFEKFKEFQSEVENHRNKKIKFL